MITCCGRSPLGRSGDSIEHGENPQIQSAEVSQREAFTFVDFFFFVTVEHKLTLKAHE